MQSKLERRELIWLLGGAATWPLAAHAQQAKQIRRVAVLSGLAETDPQGKLNIAAFRAALQELGWAEDRNIRIEFCFDTQDASGIRAAVTELIEKQPEVILAQGTAITTGLQRATSTIPIVFTVVSDPETAITAQNLTVASS
jgi:ABC-type uncharacterized transport system substrate-binding protein